MKPFNLEEYLANPERKVVTRCGKEVEIISAKGRKQFPIIGYVDNNQLPTSWCGDGRFMKDKEKINSFDLFFADEEDEESEDEVIRKEILDYFNKKKDYRSKWFNWVNRATTQKPAKWSEEDKIILEGSCDALEILCNWLKNLRPVPNWKPSEEQMDALNSAVSIATPQTYATLSKLFNDLKKLMEESIRK